MKKTREWLPVLISLGIAFLGSALQCAVLAPVPWWADAFPSLYYIPIVIAAINLGIRAALSVALLSGLSYAGMSAIGASNAWMPAVTETLLYAGVGITAGWLTRIHGSLAGASQEISPAPGGRHRDNAFLGAQGAGEIPSPNQIVAGLVHRFRTPVSSIEGAVSLLEDRRLPEEKRVEFLRIIQKESHQLDRALSDILDYTQPRKGKWRMVDLSQLVDQVIERSGLKEHDPYFLIRKDIAPDMPRPNCDPEQVGNMLLNLVMNSIQAPPGGGQVVVAARPDADNVVITVKDHGCGIAPDIIARVFDPFFTTRENGLGLGLTVARQIAVAHCGNIMVIGSSEKGTCVSVRLPLNPPNPHEQRPHIGS